MLYDTLLPEREELIEVKSKSGKDHLYAHSRHRGNQYVSGFEYPFNYCIVPLNGCSLLADSEIPQLVAKKGSAALLCSCALLASTRLRFLTTRIIRPRMPGIRGDTSRILNNSLFYLQAKSIELSLEFRPDRSILTGLHQPLSEMPYGHKIRNVLWKSEKVHEREPIHRLPLEFGIGEPVPLLEHEQLDHYHFIDVWSSASFAPVRPDHHERSGQLCGGYGHLEVL